MSLTSNGRHTAAGDGWWARRSKAGKVGLITLALFLVAGVAVALFLIRSGITGSVTGASYVVNVHAIHPANDCPGTSIVSNQINISWPDAVLNDTCDLVVDFRGPTTNTGDVKFQQFKVPAGLTATLFDAPTCGKVVPNTNASTTIWIDLTFDGTQSNIVFDPNVDGYDFVRSSVPADFNPALCNGVTP